MRGGVEFWVRWWVRFRTYKPADLFRLGAEIGFVRYFWFGLVFARGRMGLMAAFRVQPYHGFVRVGLVADGI